MFLYFLKSNSFQLWNFLLSYMRKNSKIFHEINSYKLFKNTNKCPLVYDYNFILQ